MKKIFFILFIVFLFLGSNLYSLPCDYVVVGTWVEENCLGIDRHYMFEDTWYMYSESTALYERIGQFSISGCTVDVTYLYLYNVWREITHSFIVNEIDYDTIELIPCELFSGEPIPGKCTRILNKQL